MRVRLRALWLLPVLVAAASTYLSAQIVSGTIVGTVQDQTGAVVPNVQITVTETDKNVARTAVTNQVGEYMVFSLPPGRYQVRASAQGFQTEVVSDIGLSMDQRARVDITLKVGDLAQTTTVEANAVILNTEDASLGQVIESKKIVDLPLNGRNFLQLASLSAGVVTSFGRGSTEADSFTRRANSTVHVGGRGDTNSFLVDGVDARQNTIGFLAVPLSVDTIKEFKVQSHNFSAEYGFGSAVISASTKSGTNDIHGTLFEFLRNDRLDARSFFESSKKPYRQNQFGGAVGGPILRNRTFFFGAYEGLRIREGSTFVVRTPSTRELSGNFAGIANIKDPLNNTPFPGNVIPESRISKFARTMNTIIPAAPTPGAFQNLSNSFRRDFDQYVGRIDHQFSSKHQLFGRFISHNDDLLTPSFVQYAGFESPLHTRNIAVQDTYTISPTVVNALKAGFSHVFRDTANQPYPRDLSEDLGLRNFRQPEGEWRLPSLSILGYDGFGGTGYGFGEVERTFQVSDTLMWLRGKHTISTGFDFRKWSIDATTFEDAAGSLLFQGGFTNNSIGDYLLGIPREVSVYAGTARETFLFNGYAAFLQDDIKVSRTLTLNLGVRYEYAQPPSAENGKTQTFDFSRGVLVVSRPLAEGGINFPLTGVEEKFNRQPRIPDRNNWAPRIGIAWRPLGNDDTVIRAGYGIYYGLTQFMEMKESTIQEPPYRLPVSLQTPPDRPTLFIDRGDVIPPPGQLFYESGEKLTLQAVFNRGDRTPYIQQWNFGIQRRISDYLLEATYSGSKGTKMGVRVPLNAAIPSPLPNPQSRRPYQNFGIILGRLNPGNSTYNSLQLRVEKRYARGLTLLAAYTWAHSLDYESREPSATVIQDPNNLRGSYGNSAFDVRHRFVSSIVYDLPFGRGRAFGGGANRIVDKIIGGWQANAIISLNTGNHFSPNVRTDQANAGAGYKWIRPDVARDPVLPRDQRRPERWFDTSAFVLQPFGQYGNAARNLLVAPGINLVDLSFFKNNPITESVNLQFRTEFFNTFNHANFGVPGITFDAPATFGVIRSSGPGRQIQFGLKLIF